MGKIIFRHWILNNQWISLTSLIIFAAILSSPGIIMAGSYFSRNGHYYERILIPPNTTWHQCRDSAVALGGYLAIATSEDENNFLAHLAAPYMTFLGGTDEAIEGQWLWLSGESWSFTAWRSGEPNNAWEDEDYIGLSPLDSLWNDMRNWFYDPQCFIIEYGTEPPIDTMSHGIIRVPSDRPTIQFAIDSAVNGDTVLVAHGIYVENIDFRGKSVLVISECGPDSTAILALDESKPVISFISSEPKGAGICGFTISGGGKSGIYCYQSTPYVAHNIITNNYSFIGDVAGGITLEECSDALIANNIIFDNFGGGNVGGIQISYGSYDSIANNIIYGNTGQAQIRCLWTGSSVQICNNTICPKGADGIWNQGGDVLNIKNNIIFNCTGTAVVALGGSILAKYNCTFGNATDYNFAPGAGNIYGYAEFIDSSNHDYRLNDSSPCINAGDPNPLLNDPDGSRSDIGAIPAILPDLKILQISYPIMTYLGGAQISCNIALSNFGAPITDSIFLCLYLSADSIIGNEDDIDISKESQILSGRWITGFTFWRDLSIDLPSDIPCDHYYVGAIIDCGDSIVEFNEGNNGFIESNPGLSLRQSAIQTPDQPQATIGCGYIDLVWNSIDGGISYCIYRDDQQLVCLSDTTWRDSDPGLNERCYKIMAKDDCPGESQASLEMCVIASPSAVSPNSPKTVSGCGYVDIVWNSVPDVDSFCIYRDGIPLTWKTDTVCRDSSPGNIQHCYSISSINRCGESAMSQEMCETAKIILATPSKPIATAGCENIDIKWKSITGATLYMLYRNDALIASLPDTAWTDYDPGISSVCYKVMASNSCGDSPPSQKTCNALKTPPDASSITPAVSPVNPEIGHNYTISWPSVSGASSYVLYESGIQIDSGVFLSKTFNKHSYNSFRYEVSGCNGCGCGGKSNQCIIDIALDISNADDMSLPTSYAISQNYPNPFNSATKISFDVPHLSHVSIEIFDIMGRRLVLIIDQDMPAGKYNIVWTGIDANGINAPSGVYFYKMKAEGFVESRKMMILK